MAKPKKVELIEQAEEALAEAPTIDIDHQELLDLYATMRKLGINSIGDVEVRLSRY